MPVAPDDSQLLPSAASIEDHDIYDELEASISDQPQPILAITGGPEARPSTANSAVCQWEQDAPLAVLYYLLDLAEDAERRRMLRRIIVRKT